MKNIILFIIAVTIFSCNNTQTNKVDITDKYGEPDGPHTSTEWKIWALSTAAPSFIAANCTVIDSDGKTVLRKRDKWMDRNGWESKRYV